MVYSVFDNKTGLCLVVNIPVITNDNASNANNSNDIDAVAAANACTLARVSAFSSSSSYGNNNTAIIHNNWLDPSIIRPTGNSIFAASHDLIILNNNINCVDVNKSKSLSAKMCFATITVAAIGKSSFTLLISLYNQHNGNNLDNCILNSTEGNEDREDEKKKLLESLMKKRQSLLSGLYIPYLSDDFNGKEINENIQYYTNVVNNSIVYQNPTDSLIKLMEINKLNDNLNNFDKYFEKYINGDKVKEIDYLCTREDDIKSNGDIIETFSLHRPIAISVLALVSVSISARKPIALTNIQKEALQKGVMRNDNVDNKTLVDVLASFANSVAKKNVIDNKENVNNTPIWSIRLDFTFDLFKNISYGFGKDNQKIFEKKGDKDGNIYYHFFSSTSSDDNGGFYRYDKCSNNNNNRNIVLRPASDFDFNGHVNMNVYTSIFVAEHLREQISLAVNKIKENIDLIGKNGNNNIDSVNNGNVNGKWMKKNTEGFFPFSDLIFHFLIKNLAKNKKSGENPVDGLKCDGNNYTKESDDFLLYSPTSPASLAILTNYNFINNHNNNPYSYFVNVNQFFDVVYNKIEYLSEISAKDASAEVSFLTLLDTKSNNNNSNNINSNDFIEVKYIIRCVLNNNNNNNKHQEPYVAARGQMLIKFNNNIII